MPLKKVFISVAGAQRGTFTLPDGKEVIITKNEPYFTTSRKELEFFARQRFISIGKINEKDWKHCLYHPKNLPHILRVIAEDSPYTKAHKFSIAEEKDIRANLIALGYDVDKHKDSGTDDTDLLIETLIQRGYKVIPPDVKIDPEDIPTMEANLNSKDYENMPFKELRKLCKLKNINSFGLKKAQIIEKLKEKDAVH